MKADDEKDEHPFVELIEQHGAAIGSICRSFCSSVEDREDLRQEVLLNLWRGWKRYRPEHKAITWVYRVALNTAISWRRRRKRQVETLPLVDFDLPDDTDLQEQSAHLKALIAQLPMGDQRLIGLYLDGFASNEIARLLGSSRTNVTTRIGRIKEKLKQLNEI
jgi:RNA polymerase sigma-70 factor (ECF subfamily)